MVRAADEDDRLRAATFAFLERLGARDGAVSWHDLQRFEFEGRRIQLVGQTGIRKVRDERTWKGKVHMRLGPVSLSFSGTVTLEERDDEAQRVVLTAKGIESKGKGAAKASVTSWLEPGEGETTVKMIADIQLTGSIAQLSRGPLPEVSKKLTAEFASCLQESMLASEVPLGEAVSAAVTSEGKPSTPPAGSPATGSTAPQSDRPQ